MYFFIPLLTLGIVKLSNFMNSVGEDAALLCLNLHFSSCAFAWTRIQYTQVAFVFSFLWYHITILSI